MCWRTCGKEASYSWIENIVMKGKPRVRSLGVRVRGVRHLFFFFFSFLMKSPLKNEPNVLISILRLHSEGWLLDVYRRVHGEEGTFFVPLDLEISSQELSYIVKRAEQWRGVNGERRLVSGEQSPKQSLAYCPK